MSATSEATIATGTSTWQIDAAHTGVEFSVKHLMISRVKGQFAAVSGSLVLDERDLTTSSVEVTIDVSSVDTRDEKRDAHLRSADFFDVAKFPTMRFVSRRIERTGNDTFTLVGDLTIRDVTREIALAATNEGSQKDPWGGERIGFSATTTIDRRDYGLTWNHALETGGVLVGNDVKISLDVQAVKQDA
jgi:polyisoprenoid-binding protein YceI